MQTYSATIRLSGSLFNEVPRKGLTAAEIVVLKRLHGDDAVVNIAPDKRNDVTDEQERDRLEAVYGKALANIENVRTLSALLGPPGVPLPKTVPGVDSLPPADVSPRGRKPKEPTETPAEPAPIPAEEFA